MNMETDPRELAYGEKKTMLQTIYLNEEDTNDDVARAIVMNLQEPNQELVYKIVNALGKEMSIYFYNKTKCIEENGGLLTFDRTRRRSPGGVFMYLINRDESLPQETVKEIFFDVSQKSKKKKVIEIKERRRRHNEILKERLIKEGLLSTLNNNNTIYPGSYQQEPPTF